ncbi:hypothetical protein LOD99_2850 [Oopsacas minuta]|uniref:BZIP domain-containing protein n=1 Tax=Oopsacas minuta TaxID=111878 RepID=A0AAV7K1D8_9METZ|nr:hypothetical protein LOD99_2850 [Oopsacas minuta]
MLKSDNVCIISKCNRAICILKDNYKDLLQNGGDNFLDIVDIDKLVYTKASKLTPLLDTNVFSEIEKNWIKENRRKAINRKTAGESRDRKKREQSKLVNDLKYLERYRDVLSQQKEEFIEEIYGLKWGIRKMSFEYSLAIPTNQLGVYSNT